jgi:hypothetical protein
VRAGWIPSEAILRPARSSSSPSTRLKHLTRYGCARTLYQDEGTPETIAPVVEEMLGDSSYCTRAGNLADKAATAPTAVGTVPLIEELVAGKAEVVTST